MPGVNNPIIAASVKRSSDDLLHASHPNGDFSSSNIAGDTTHGGTITISGSGFGTKSTPEPLVYDDFSSGSNGSLIAGNAPLYRAIGGSWTWLDYTSGSLRPIYSTARSRGPAGIVSHHRYSTNPNDYNCSLEIDQVAGTTGQEFYFSFWMRYEKTTTDWSRNIKPWVNYGNHDGINPSAYIGWGNPDEDDGGLRNSIQDISGNLGQTLWGGPEIGQLEGGEWFRIELYLKVSGPGQNNGAWDLHFVRPDGDGITNPQKDLTYSTRGTSGAWVQWHFGSYHSSDAVDDGPLVADGDIYIDEIYFDSTRARVEMGDAATWAACTHREVLVATAWSDTQITARMNHGSFGPGTRYIYVIDASGNVVNANNGYAVTI